ncbi:MAG: thiamine pyrophosphate-dependent enzyme [Anaerolineae bacterium]
MESMHDPAVDTADILNDYHLAILSREASLLGRREVMSGKAKFGIFGDGKEVAQLALARMFEPGDFRSGYYRDQTLMLALGLLTLEEFFAQLYAHGEIDADPSSAGRQMNAHFANRLLDEQGRWLRQTDRYNSAADVSPTGSQMPRLVGLGYASTLYRHLPDLQQMTDFSQQGKEVAFGTIGNASCAEGMFWEAVNAIGVLRAPVVLSIWDDDYGISVPNEYQITKRDLTAVLSGFQREANSSEGYDIYTVRGWDYPALLAAYRQATATARRDHIPAIVHVIEITQPQGHSTSGSHERYKSAERLAWEEEYDCIRKMREWMLDEEVADPDQLDQIEEQARSEVRAAMDRAWQAFTAPIHAERDALAGLLEEVAATSRYADAVRAARTTLMAARSPLRKDIMSAARKALFATRGESTPVRDQLKAWQTDYAEANRERYSSFLYSRSDEAAHHVAGVSPTYPDDPQRVPGFQILNANFDALLASDPRVVAFGEDLGMLGGVNQGFAGLQEKYGPLRVSDTGIREATILGQAIGMAMRGLRPIAEIQYLDYVLYALQIISDDLATLHWRTRGGQKAPVIIRTRGHRLEGIWHSGSLMAGIINLVRGIHVIVPRDMTRAAGFYNTLVRSDEPGLIVEVLNGYRLREPLPDNPGEFTIPLGEPEILREGTDITVVTYGACVRIAQEAAEQLAEAGIDVELVDVQTLLPFDRHNRIGDSLAKTNRILFLDEDVPGGTTAYMMQKVIEKQGGFWELDSEPRTLSAEPHRPPYGSDGSYFSKPSVEDVIETVYDIMNESDPDEYPTI